MSNEGKMLFWLNKLTEACEKGLDGENIDYAEYNKLVEDCRNVVNNFNPSFKQTEYQPPVTAVRSPTWKI